MDFGCGTAEYVKEFRNNFFICDGYDGNPDTLQLTRGIGKIIDLSEPFDLGNQFDWVLSLEVGEHLPKQFETIFIENLHYHNIQGIVLSWAIEGQGGYGHFNERNNDYVKGVMASYGYINDVAAETELRKNVSGCSYFRDTLMVFRKTYQP